ncbi:hypothetical protein [Helicobacter trogontum]|uniref:hypothetical protein n=1 Tax=Helicobacter trogontum TaxID=50960 RepID=UPI001319ED5A|nr:hypothetical protein [Helicobacter trogontum]
MDELLQAMHALYFRSFKAFRICTKLDSIYGSIAKHKHTLVRQFNYSYLPCI